ncbi:MAG: sulfite exporter TauE/SafE family protein [Polyangiales bacterium]
MLTAVASGAALGLANVAHCAGMCGPLCAASCGRRDAVRLARYQLGRMAGYGFLGATSGELGAALTWLPLGRFAPWICAALTVGGCLLALRSLFRANVPPLVKLGPRRSEPFSLLRLMPREPLALGLASALLPCGALAGAVLAAAASGSAREGTGLMLSFAAVSGIAVLVTASAAGQLARMKAPAARLVLACVLLAAGGVAVARPFRALASAAPSSAAVHCH